MSFQNFKADSFCVSQKHYTGAKNTVGEITYINKSSREIKLCVGKCVICDRQKSMIVTYNTIQAEGLGSFFKTFGKISAKAGKKLATNAFENQFLKSVLTLLPQSQVEILKQLYQHYLK